MPYLGEFANKSSHEDIIRNPEVAEFLSSCEYLTQPSDEEAGTIVRSFVDAPSTTGISLPQHVIAIDGSLYESSLDKRLPSTKVGYIKIGGILIQMSEVGALRVHGGRFVDPFRVAKLEEHNWPLTFTLPSANVKSRGCATVQESFRHCLDRQLYDHRTRFNAGDPATSLRTTLFHLAALRTGDLFTGDPHVLKIHRCPSCDQGPLEVYDQSDDQQCPHCHRPIYPTDCLRLWEEVSEFQSNEMALNRFMGVVEHLLPIHYIRHIYRNSSLLLGSLAFFIDGPLARFGTSAWLHASIMKYIFKINQDLKRLGTQEMVMIGLQKTGQIVDHVSVLDRYIPVNHLLPINDEYRYKYIVMGRDPSAHGFGSETYYGQDFIYKTPSGRTFVLGIPYPFEYKEPVREFSSRKTDISIYDSLPRALALIQHFETDLYTNAVIPIALAHRYTAISLEPGGTVLDLLTERALG
ncbi:MAG: DNA double-strand break repair nuclease NurA [Dehalococcoidales bacterium]|nr:DNA double-strand break repair nuclease NurA [Dehalococcoidales bacterium]